MKHILLIALTSFFIAACSTTPKMSDFSNDPDAMWEQGKKQSDKGEKLIVRGESTLEKSRKILREGEALIQLGSDTIIRSREEYQLEASKIGGSSSPKEVEFEAKRLMAIGDKWEDAIADVKKGNSMVAKSKTIQSEAQALIKEGRELVEVGSNFIRNSQRMRLNIPLLDAPASS
jgi:hypothetical protein